MLTFPTPWCCPCSARAHAHKHKSHHFGVACVRLAIVGRLSSFHRYTAKIQPDAYTVGYSSSLWYPNNSLLMFKVVAVALASFLRSAHIRYRLPVVVLVMNNAGIYGGDRRPDALAAAAQRGMQAGGFGSDPAPTAFVPYAR
eukprot:scaffold269927_cov21-Tisochrysis_lutea.AAC.3